METITSLINVARNHGIDFDIVDASLLFDMQAVVVGGAPGGNLGDIVTINLSGRDYITLLEGFLDSGALPVSKSKSEEIYGLFWARWL